MDEKIAQDSYNKRRISFKLGKIIQDNGMVLVLIGLMAFMAFLSPNFLSKRNLINLAIQNCTIAIVAMGITFVLIAGDIDLSLGSIVGLVAILTCGLTKYNGLQEWQSILAALLLALVVGAANGWIISRFKLESVVVTLGTWYIVQGLVQNYILSRVPTAPPFTSFIGSESILKIPVIVMVTVVMIIIAHLILSKTVLGHWAYSLGGNPVSAKISGVPVTRVKITLFCLSAFYAFVSSLLMTGRIHAVDASTGSGLVFLAPAAAVVGGTSLFGGKGRAINAVVGALIMGVIANGLNLTRVSFFWQQVAVGAAILIAVTIDALQRRRE